MRPIGQAELLARGNLGFYVELRSGIFTDKNSGQTWANAFASHARNFAFQFGEDFIADFDPVENACGHSISLSSSKKK